MPAAHHQPFHRQATELKHAHCRRLSVWTTLLAVRTEFYICTPAVAQTKNVDCRGTGLVTRSRNLTGSSTNGLGDYPSGIDKGGLDKVGSPGHYKCGTRGIGLDRGSGTGPGTNAALVQKPFQTWRREQISNCRQPVGMTGVTEGCIEKVRGENYFKRKNKSASLRTAGNRLRKELKKGKRAEE
uniref:Uncharacterized protein n=1 Tax=Coccidioides posadasii RMSCC 3488 TaxID=454284 RepID=A0A0J6FC23_COCPO|nr:hypothetical protein CPAG_02833 [Coccidioides posadasii RMSCC 3488]